MCVWGEVNKELGVRFWIIGRVQAQYCRREILGFAPTQATLFRIVLKDPGAAQNLNSMFRSFFLLV